MKHPQINVQQLISFYHLAKEGSFSAASERLFVTQPAVTQQIKALESQFGVKLVNVKRKRVHLTEAGTRLASYAQEVVTRVVAAETFLKAYRVKNLHVGVATALVRSLTPAIDRFKEIYPSVTVSVREGPSLSLVEGLLDYKYDVCLVGTLQAVDRNLRVIHFPVVEKMVFVANPEYIPNDKCELTWDELATYPLILQPEGSTARAILLKHFADRHLVPMIGAEVDNIECAKVLARQKKGLALMFLPNVHEEVTQGRLAIVPIADGGISLGIDIVLNEEVATSPIMEGFLGVIRERLDQLFSPVQRQKQAEAAEHAGRPA
jgi:DNA-binding transcriptional LysR family regulator